MTFSNIISCMSPLIYLWEKFCYIEILNQVDVLTYKSFPSLIDSLRPLITNYIYFIIGKLIIYIGK